ncbi:MAG: CoA pyrophosphatase [Deltaproteobacteria bacterium]|nr:CoA pyrophosphatase [Deltaproteobacteria bacterium]MBW2121561.1 CoA pyrophosphatase [Deltaproteobacteria bacterium]
MRANPESLEEKIRAVLAARERKRISKNRLIPAAVLLPLFKKAGEPYVLLTKRTEKVKAHKGEISFPGGVYDRADRSLEETALRESFEEIGLKRSDVEILGCLDDVETMTRYLIRPYVGIFPYPYTFVVNGEEIEEMIEVPLRSILRKGAFETRSLRSGTGRQTIYSYRFGRHLIWGATARILKQLVDLIRDSSGGRE